MKLTYTKISQNLYKFFSEENGYGEFYLWLEKDGTAHIGPKDPEYANHLIKVFSKAMKEIK